MTTTQSATAMAGVSANNGAPEAVAPHAYVENGTIRLLQFGRVETVTRWEAVCALSAIADSDIPSSQERARQIRAALINQPKETYYGHAH